MPTGNICSVAVCKNSYYKQKRQNAEKIAFFTFPKQSILQQEWLKRCFRKDEINVKTGRICSVHFKNEDFVDDIQPRVMGTEPKLKLKSTAIPSLYLKPEREVSNSEKKVRTSAARSTRATCRQNKKIVAELLQQHFIQEKCGSEETPDLLELPSVKETPEEGIKHNCEKLIIENQTMQRQLEMTQRELLESKEKIAHLNKTLQDTETDVEKRIVALLSGMFSKNQIQIILKKKTRARWTADEISAAFTIRYFSKRCYLYLRNTLRYPLPGLSTLQKWATNLNLKNGHLNDMLQIMEICGRSKTELQKVTVLCFDEMKVSSLYEYDQKEDEIIGPHKYVQVIMARGLFDNWKQPVYIGFDSKMTKEILMTAIAGLQSKGYCVVAIVSDCGGGNQGLWTSLEISAEKVYFLHPTIEERIYVFADAPHLLKLLRNWFIDTGFELEDGSVLKKDLINELIENSNTEINSLHKLSKLHIEVRKTRRQNVALAAELMSHTTSTALMHYFQKEKADKKKAAHTLGNFIDLVSRWFDLMNSYTPNASVKSKKPYGINLEAQNTIIQDAIETFSKMKCIGKKSMQVFQRGLIISLKSLQCLFADFRNKYNVAYLITHRLNQDCLENFFSQLRTRGGLHDHPSPLNTIYRIRMILLGKNPGLVQRNTNVQHSMEEFIVAKALQQAKIIKLQIEAPLTIEEDDPLEISSTSSSSSTSSLTKTTIKSDSEKDGLVYIAGYLAYKYKDKYPQLGDHTYKTVEMHSYALPSWIQHLSFGGLINPADDWAQSVKKMEKYFKNINGKEIKRGKGIVEEITTVILKKCSEIPQELIKAFSRQRVFIRIKYLNFLRNEELNKKKRKNPDDTDDISRKTTKKMKKIVY